MTEQPEAIALSFQGYEITYAELNRNSNRIAHALLAQGLEAGQPVALLLGDGPEPVTAMLGVLKAGGVIVFLDPAYPTQRLVSIYGEAKPDWMIARSDFLNGHLALRDVDGVDLKALLLLDHKGAGNGHDSFAEAVLGSAEIASADTHNPDRRTTPDDRVYIVYTSGSTGTPKGIVQSHRSFSQYIEWQSRQFGVRAPERFAQWASFAYDACYREVFCTLGFGATLCLATAATRYTPKSLIDWMREDRVSIFNVVPSFWRQVIEIVKTEHRDETTNPFPDLKVLLHPGEPMPVDLAETWLNRFPNPARLFNLYGPSECILATYHEVTSVTPEQRSIPIGTPIGGREILILDDQQKPCDAGVEGEIYVRSRFLTMGYFDRPEETAEKYLTNPLTGDPEDRVYRTGDLGRLREDGLIEFAGRKDRMVKIRGQRVELGDIEHVLRGEARIGDCVVIVRTGAPGQQTMVALERGARQGAADEQQLLVAYYTTREAAPQAELRKLLEAKLPAHMVPQRFVELDEMPLNANRKLDIGALPEPDDMRPDLGESYVAPRNETETAIAAIWQDVLGIERIGVNDGFLELGGNSLLAMQVLNRLREKADLKFSFRDLFKEQTIAKLAATVENTGQQAAVQDVVRIVDEDSNALYPLSKAQEGLWFLWQLDPENPYYTGQGNIRIEGELNLDALNKAWNALFARHELLRVRFEQENDRPGLRFRPLQEIRLAPTDLTHLSLDESHAHLEGLMRERARKSFDLEHDSLLDYQLFKTGENEHAILITFHEVILDLWSLTVLIRDLGTLYRQFLKDPAASAPPPEFRFREYARWESTTVTQDNMTGQRAYWEEQLAGELPVLSLPTDRPYPTVPNYNGDSRSTFLNADLSARLKRVAREHDVTLFTTLLSALNVMLRIYSGQDDIIVGAPIANRQHPQSEKLVGFFLNMLPLRTQFAENETFSSVLGRMRETVTGALSHSDYPFAWMLEHANFTRDLSTQPVFQVMFNMLNLPEIKGESSGIQMTYDEYDTGYIKYDLAFYAQEQGDRIYFQIAYLTELFDAETVQRMLDNFLVLLESLSQAPQAALSDADYLTAEERTALLVDFNRTDRPYPMEESIHQLFEKQAAETPDAPALLFGDASRSYRDLNARANRLARHLQSNGVQPGDRVAICIGRSFEMVEGLLGILKAGGTYVALDTEYPPLRQNEILAASGATVLLTSGALDVFGAYQGSKILIDAAEDEIARQSDENPAPARTPDMLLNIVYTSSTTGNPKGVLIEERSVLNRLNWMWDAYPFEANDVALLQKSYAIVASTWELFGALLKGRPTVILSYDQLLDPAELWGQGTRHGVTHLLATPALIEGILLQAEANSGGWPSLRFATTSAEQIPVKMVEQWKQAFPGVPLLNLYGSTECASNATAFDTGDLDPDALRVPVGKPIANVNVFVLDNHGNPLPIGATGEMCVSGACVARGYLDNEMLTGEKFLPNELSDQGHPAIYRTGDLAAFRPDGNLELVGRADDQVTIRGFRVELSDIESVLMRHSDVEKAAAVAVGTGSRRRLVAYIAPANRVTAADVRAYLLERLPGYMVPAEYVLLDAIPLTRQGKIDRRALSGMVGDAADMSAAYVAPRTEMETYLASLWANLLGVETVGIHDNFFELGGHSLLAVQFFAELRKTTGADLPLATLFQLPTVAELAERLDSDDRKSDWSSLVPIRPGGDGYPLFCVHGVYGDVLFYRELADNVAEGHPVYGLQPPTLSGGALPFDDLRALAAHYADLVRQVQPSGPYHICGYSFGGAVAMEMARNLRNQGADIGALAIFDSLIGSGGADIIQHSENMGHTRIVNGVSFGAMLRRKLRDSYPVWRTYMTCKTLYVTLAGHLHDLYVRRGNILPREHRSAYTAWSLRRLSARYSPQDFDDHLILFCSKKRKQKVVDTWRPIVKGDLSVINVSGDDHLFIYDAACAKFLADELSKRFERPKYDLAAE